MNRVILVGILLSVVTLVFAIAGMIAGYLDAMDADE